ncbi:hypothetical protein, partial [Pseudomonas sp. GW704-F5]|uniref:hypothetical protein n=1 Tax=Pseudomonas sp. GW704-F5 TaxID=2070576 RepID=UPI001C45F729
ALIDDFGGGSGITSWTTTTDPIDTVWMIGRAYRSSASDVGPMHIDERGLRKISLNLFPERIALLLRPLLDHLVAHGPLMIG